MAELIFIVEPRPDARETHAGWLRAAGFDVRMCATAAECLQRLAEDPLVICLTAGTGDETHVTLRELARRAPRASTVIIGVDALHAQEVGAWDGLEVDPEQARLIVAMRNACAAQRLRRDVERLRGEVGVRFAARLLIGHSGAAAELHEHVERIAPSEVPVLLHGEHGTGKQLVARAIHHRSARGSGPFVTVHCRSLPPDEQDAELFGRHRHGALASPARGHGRFDLAAGGTVLLDDVAALTPVMQTKLLRALQSGSVTRAGGGPPVTIDVRLISTTRESLAELVVQGKFVEELYYRLGAYTIRFKPLRERREDIPALARHFLGQVEQEHGPRIDRITPEAMQAMMVHAWPGNVRELQSVMHRAVVTADRHGIAIGDLPFALRSPRSGTAAAAEAQATAIAEALSLSEAERRCIASALKVCQGNVTETARRLGIGRATLYRKLARHRLDARSERDGDTG